MRVPLIIRKNPIFGFIREKTPNSIKGFFSQESSNARLRDIALAVCKGKMLIPTMITLEFTNHCNAMCVFCPQPFQMKRSKGFMGDELFELVLKNIKMFNIGYVMLGGTGESFLDKKIIDRIVSMKKLGVNVTVTTNGSILGKIDAKKVVESGIDKISISMDSFDDDYLYKIKPGIKEPINKIEKAVKNIYSYKKKNGFATPHILLRYQILENSNNLTDKEVEKKIILSKRKVICDDVELRKQHNWRGEKAEIGNVNKPVATGENICNFLCRYIKVTWNGDVAFCCMDFDNKIVLGNLFKNNIVEIFNSSQMKKARKMFLDGTINKHPLCSGCYS